MQYEVAYDLQDLAYEVIDKLKMKHVDKDRISCVRSKGAKSPGVIARVHGLAKAMQLGMDCKAFYVIEFLDRFEKCSRREQVETVIHELLHIPQNFGGGFRHHDYVQNKRVRELYNKFIKDL